VTTDAERRLAASALSQAGSTALGLAGGVGLSILVARALGPDEMGGYALALMIVTALEAVAGFGLARTAVRFIAGQAGTPEAAGVLRWLLVRRLVAAAVATVALVAAAPLFGALFHDDRLPPLLVVGSLVLLTNLPASVLESALEGLSRFDLLARVTLGGTLLYGGTTLLALALAGSALAVLAAQAVSGLAILGLLALSARRAGALSRRAPAPDAASSRRLLRFARQGYLLSLLSFVVHDRVEVLVLGAFSTQQQVAFYSVALSAAEAAMRLGPLIVATVFFPLLAADWTRADRPALAARYGQCVRYVALTTMPLALVGGVVAEAGVALVFGPSYGPMVPALRLSLLGAAAAALAEPPAAVLAAAERQDWLLRVRGPLAVSALALDVALAPAFGAVGAACANVAVAGVDLVAVGLLTRRLGAATPVLGLGIPLLAGGLAAVAAAPTLGDRTDAPRLILALLVGGAVYVTTLIAARFFTPEDAAIVAPLVRRFRGAPAIVP